MLLSLPVRRKRLEARARAEQYCLGLRTAQKIFGARSLGRVGQQFCWQIINTGFDLFDRIMAEIFPGTSHREKTDFKPGLLEQEYFV